MYNFDHVAYLPTCPPDGAQATFQDHVGEERGNGPKLPLVLVRRRLDAELPPLPRRDLGELGLPCDAATGTVLIRINRSAYVAR